MHEKMQETGFDSFASEYAFFHYGKIRLDS